MNFIEFNNKKYCTVREIYMNLGVAREAIMRKLKRLENEGYVLRINNKRPGIYISEEGYNKLKSERIKYLDEKIEKGEGKEYYLKRKEAIEKPELWNEFHHHEFVVNFYYSNGQNVATEVKKDGKTTTYIKK